MSSFKERIKRMPGGRSLIAAKRKLSRARRKAIGTRIGGGLCILLRARHFKTRIEEELRVRLEEPPTPKQIHWCFWDYLHFWCKFLGTMDPDYALVTDYLGAQLYRKSDFFRMESFATGARVEWRNAIQDEKYWPIFTDKDKFYAAFSEHLGRGWMLVNRDTAYADYAAFVATRTVVFAKGVSGGGGKEVERWQLDSEEARRELYELCRKKAQVIEDPLIQCEALHSFSCCSAVNTVRMVTVVDRAGCPHVAAAALRIDRREEHIDNFSSGGMGAAVDVETGIVTMPARNKAGKAYIIHPDSEKQIVGFKIPDWEKYREFALTLASRFPAMRYVGWDIIQDRNGEMCVIEGNKDGGSDVLETGLLNGLLPVYNRYRDMQ